MPRGPFNTTADIIGGPGSATPGVIRGTVDVRYVPQTGIAMVGPGSPTRVAWVTMKDIQPVGGWVDPAIGFSAKLADLVAIPSGTDPQWWVIFVEEVLWRAQPFYWRAHLAYLPAPDDACDCGGGDGGGGDPSDPQETACNVGNPLNATLNFNATGYPVAITNQPMTFSLDCSPLVFGPGWISDTFDNGEFSGASHMQVCFWCDGGNGWKWTILRGGGMWTSGNAASASYGPTLIEVDDNDPAVGAVHLETVD